MKRLFVASALLGLVTVSLAASDVVTSPWKKPAPVVDEVPGGIGPVLDGTWWQLKMKAKGATVSNLDGSIGKASVKATAYMFLSSEVLKGEGIDSSFGDDGFPLYSYTMVTNVDGEWQGLFGDTLFVNGIDGSLVTDSFMGFILDEGDVGGRFTGQFKLKLVQGEDEGFLVPKKGKLKTLGAELFSSALFPEGNDNEGKAFHRFFGSMRITGKLVPPQKLPFDL